ncbi:MAG TPA: CoA transferase subunit A, partial [Rubrobacter sp.]|nr:CoA transferase subunit A [Rubrobacter sp.]
SVVPNGAHPSYAAGYYDRDNAFYEAWDPISRDRELFRGWMNEHVLSVEDFAEHTRSIEKEEAM